MLPFLATVALIVLVVFLASKKLNPSTVLFLVGILAVFGWQAATGQSILDGGTGRGPLVDTLEYVSATAANVLGDMLLVPTLLFGYLSFMDYIGATDAFTYALSKPLGRIKNRHLLATLVIPVGVLMKCVVTAGASIAVMLIGTLYPVLRARGCSKATCATAVGMVSVVAWGPAELAVINAVALTDVGVDTATFFLHHQLLSVVLFLTVICIVFYVTSVMFDKASPETDLCQTDASVPDARKPDVPLFFAVLPILPLIVMFLFSSIVWEAYAIEPGAAALACYLIALCICMVWKRRDLRFAFNGITAFADGCAECIRKSFVMMLGGQLFGAALRSIGGLSLMIDSIQAVGGDVSITVTICAALALLLVVLTGSFGAQANVFLPLFNSIALSYGVRIGSLAQVALQSCSFGAGLSPTSNTTLLISSSTEVNLTEYIKRNALPILSGMLVLILHGLLVC